MVATGFRKSVVAAALFLCFFAPGCGAPETSGRETVSFEGAIMGTTYHITVVASLDDEAADETARAIEAALRHVDGKMSTYRPDSEISRLNSAPAGVYVPLSEETFAMIRLALEVSGETGGAFDITVGPLVNAWGFGPGGPAAPPSPEKLAALAGLVGADKMELDALTKSVRKAADGVYCDLSGIAKGYAVDLVAETLEGRGLREYMVEVGGEVRTAGHNGADVPWRIAIEKPVSEGRVLQEIVGLTELALATSGDYRNFYEVDGKRVSHTIDPATGRPVDHALASVSVLHPRCALADAYATALLVLGPEKGLEAALRLDLAAMFVIHGDGGEFQVQQTEGFQRHRVAR